MAHLQNFRTFRNYQRGLLRVELEIIWKNLEKTFALQKMFLDVIITVLTKKVQNLSKFCNFYKKFKKNVQKFQF